MTDKEQQIYTELKNSAECGPDTPHFRFARVWTHYDPHPYCIGPRHVGYASDHFGGILGEEAIRAAERHGILCAMESDRPGRRERCGMRYDDHKAHLACIIVLQDGHPEDLNAIPGLGRWLSDLKPKAVALGIDNFGFPTESQERQAAR